MFYEAIRLKELPVTTIEEAIALKGLPQSDRSIPVNNITKTETYNAISLEISGIKVYLVSDVHIDDAPWGEVAIILEHNNHKAQIESYTGRVLGVPQLYDVIADYFIEPAELIHFKPAQLNFNLNGTETAWFTCSCCGDGFMGNIKEQIKHDQDSGFGLCADCDENFHL